MKLSAIERVGARWSLLLGVVSLVGLGIHCQPASPPIEPPKATSCKITCCDGKERTFEKLASDKCTESYALTLDVCSKEHLSLVAKAGKIVWRRSAPCETRCQLTCCDQSRFGLDQLSQDACLALKDATDANPCHKVGSTTQEIAHEKQQLWKRAEACQVSCLIKCCDGTGQKLSLPNGECSDANPTLVAYCGGLDQSLEISTESQSVWSSPCVEIVDAPPEKKPPTTGSCKVACCQGSGAEETLAASECTAATQASRCPGGNYKEITFNGKKIDAKACPPPTATCKVTCCNGSTFASTTTEGSCVLKTQASRCTGGHVRQVAWGSKTSTGSCPPATGACKVTCCPGIASPAAKTTTSSQCSAAIFASACQGGLYQTISFNGATRASGSCAKKACVVQCCDVHYFTTMTYPFQCKFSEHTGKTCKEHFSIRSITYNGAKVISRGTSCIQGECQVTCCKSSIKVPPEKKYVGKCNRAEVGSPCNGKGIKSITFKGHRTFAGTCP